MHALIGRTSLYRSGPTTKVTGQHSSLNFATSFLFHASNSSRRISHQRRYWNILMTLMFTFTPPHFCLRLLDIWPEPTRLIGLLGQRKWMVLSMDGLMLIVKPLACLTLHFNGMICSIKMTRRHEASHSSGTLSQGFPRSMRITVRLSSCRRFKLTRLVLAGNAKRLEMHVGKMHQHDGVTQTSPNQRRSSATRPPSVPDPSPVSYVSFPSPIYHAQQATIPAYLPHSFPSPVYFQASRRQSTTSRVTETSTTPITIANSGPPIYQAPMRPLMPQSFIPTSRNIDRTEAQGGSLGRNNKMTRKDFHSDPLAQAWTPKPGYSKNFHVLYSAGNPGPFQYHRLPMSNRQRGYLTKSSNLHRGIRNPPKQISDDARTLSDTVSHDSPDWVAATSLPLNHGLAPEPHFKRPSRTSSLGSGGQLVDYRNRDPSNFRDVVQPQLSASARTPIRVDNEQVSKPRFVSNPFTMYKILEEDHSSVHARDQLALEQQGTFERSEIHPTLQEQQAPTRKTLQPIFYQFQEDPSRDPLAPTPNAGYNRPNPAQQRNDMSNCKLWVANFSSEATRNDLIEVLMYLPGFIDVEEPRSPGNYRHCWTFVR